MPAEMTDPAFSHRATAVLASPCWVPDWPDGMPAQEARKRADALLDAKEHLRAAVHRARRFEDMPLTDREAFERVEEYNERWEATRGRATQNANPKGCNQYTGPGCAEASSRKIRDDWIEGRTPQMKEEMKVAQAKLDRARAAGNAEEAKKQEAKLTAVKQAASDRLDAKKDDLAWVGEMVRKRGNEESMRLVLGAMREYGGFKSPRKEHGMAESEDMRSLDVGGMKFTWSSGTEGVAAQGIVNHLRDPVHPVLLAATKEVVFTEQGHKDDPHWARVFGIRLEQAMASGGEGKIVAYNGRTLDHGLMSHECGHNLAEKLWGNAVPPPGSAYGKAQKDEPPVTNYGKTNPAEDFAEACRLYSNPETREGMKGGFLRRGYQKKLAALEDIFSQGR